MNYSGSKFTRMRYLLIILFVFNALLTDKCVFFLKEKNFAIKYFFRIFLSNFLSPERSNFEVSKANTSFFFYYILHLFLKFKIKHV